METLPQYINAFIHLSFQSNEERRFELDELNTIRTANIENKYYENFA